MFLLPSAFNAIDGLKSLAIVCCQTFFVFYINCEENKTRKEKLNFEFDDNFLD